VRNNDWPRIDYEASRETLQALQLWMQVVGKVRLALTPWLNHSWHVPLYVTARGLGTSPISFGGELLEIEFDLIAHCLVARTSRGQERALALAPGAMRDAYAATMAMLRALGVDVRIDQRPNEIPDATPFSADAAPRAYEPEVAHAFWRALIAADRVFKQFRTAFIGKASPSHFFWGSFDLAVTRFSGRRAPLHPGGVPGLPDAVTQEAYSHEVSSAGFWPGDARYPHAAFYSYAYPAPASFASAKVAPAAARYVDALGEWMLPYEAVRTARWPERRLLDFLESTYAAAADGAHWDRAALECSLGALRRPRVVNPASRP
jgi:hypothetical protein